MVGAYPSNRRKKALRYAQGFVISGGRSEVVSHFDHAVVDAAVRLLVAAVREVLDLGADFPVVVEHIADTGVVAKLEAGAKVADVGCGHGASTVIMAQAFPNSRFVGFDYHAPSITVATQRAEEGGVSSRATFFQGTAKSYPGDDYDLICYFDCLHDMGDPVGAARHAYDSLKDDGTVLLVEPFANDTLDDNINPVGRLFYAASTFICTPNSLSQEVGLGLGAQAGELRLRKVFTEAGFKHFRRATQTPFNLILEARK